MEAHRSRQFVFPPHRRKPVIYVDAVTTLAAQTKACRHLPKEACALYLANAGNPDILMLGPDLYHAMRGSNPTQAIDQSRFALGAVHPTSGDPVKRQRTVPKGWHRLHQHEVDPAQTGSQERVSTMRPTRSPDREVPQHLRSLRADSDINQVLLPGAAAADDLQLGLTPCEANARRTCRRRRQPPLPNPMASRFPARRAASIQGHAVGRRPARPPWCSWP